MAFNLGLSRPKEFDINLRLPGWARGVTIKVNGQTIRPSVVNGYAKIRRQWANRDTIDLTLPMEVERLEAHPSVAADRGRVALRRGPLIYCLEEQDQKGDPDLIVLPMAARLEGRFEPGLLNGVTVIAGQGLKISTQGWEDQLYRPAAISERESVTIRAIPYYAWGNRQSGKFAVWLQSSR